MDMSKSDFRFYLLCFGEVLEFRGKEIKQNKTLEIIHFGMHLAKPTFFLLR